MYQSPTFRPPAPSDPSLLPLNLARLDELFDPEAIIRHGLWDQEEMDIGSEARSVTGLEHKIVRTKWAQLAEARKSEVSNTIHQADPRGSAVYIRTD